MLLDRLLFLVASFHLFYLSKQAGTKVCIPFFKRILLVPLGIFSVLIAGCQTLPLDMVYLSNELDWCLEILGLGYALQKGSMLVRANADGNAKRNRAT